MNGLRTLDILLPALVLDISKLETGLVTQEEQQSPGWYATFQGDRHPL